MPGCPCVSPRSLPHCGAQVTTIPVVCDDPVAVGYDRTGKAPAGSVHSRTIAAVLYGASDEVAVTVYVCAITVSCGGQPRRRPLPAWVRAGIVLGSTVARTTEVAVEAANVVHAVGTLRIGCRR